jgi:hypothetical protein
MQNDKSSYENIDSLQKVIDTLVLQIETISSRCQMDSNRKGQKINLMEYSSTMLHLSKTLGELILIKRAIEQGKTEEVFGLINGRIK